MAETAPVVPTNAATPSPAAVKAAPITSELSTLLDMLAAHRKAALAEDPTTARKLITAFTQLNRLATEEAYAAVLTYYRENIKGSCSGPKALVGVTSINTFTSLPMLAEHMAFVKAVTLGGSAVNMRSLKGIINTGRLCSFLQRQVVTK